MEREKMHIKLVDSTYDLDEAREVLLRLITDKIKFLSQKELSIQERFNSDTGHIKKRLDELKADRQELQSFLASVESGEYQAEIKCPIDITFVAKNNKQPSIERQETI